MYTIERNGQKVTLTDEEVRIIHQCEHDEIVYSDVESAVERCEENEWISFSNYAENGFGDYASESDAREDFIDKLTEDILEREELYDEDPTGRTMADYENEVLDFAEELGYRKE